MAAIDWAELAKTNSIPLACPDLAFGQDMCPIRSDIEVEVSDYYQYSPSGSNPVADAVIVTAGAVTKPLFAPVPVDSRPVFMPPSPVAKSAVLVDFLSTFRDCDRFVPKFHSFIRPTSTNFC